VIALESIVQDVGSEQRQLSLVDGLAGGQPFHRQRVSGVGISRSSQTRQRSLAPFVVGLPGDVFQTRDRGLSHRESRIDEAGAVAFAKSLSVSGAGA